MAYIIEDNMIKIDDEIVLIHEINCIQAIKSETEPKKWSIALSYRHCQKEIEFNDDDFRNYYMFKAIIKKLNDCSNGKFVKANAKIYINVDNICSVQTVKRLFRKPLIEIAFLDQDSLTLVESEELLDELVSNEIHF